MVRAITLKRIKDPKILAEFQKESLWSLLPNERLWRDRFEILRRNGYLLRSRFSPDWVPSWKGTDLNPYHCEDAFGAAGPKCIDATRIKDGVAVFIKRVIREAIETAIQKYLSSGERKDDPRNHSCPILDVFRDPEDEGYEYIVLPVLRDFNDPPFETVIDILEFVRQTLEGLIFLHKNKVAHCDCAAPNIMMDGTPLYPEGFHPAHQHKHPTLHRFAKHGTRLHSPPVKYYYIDFGLSMMYNEEWEMDPQNRCDFDGHEQAPEIRNFRAGLSHNAYLLDRYILGKVYERSLLERYSNITVLKPIIEGMTREDPEERLSPEEAIVMLSRARRSLNIFRLRGRLHLKGESGHRMLVNDIRAWFIDIPYVLKHYISRWFTKSLSS